MEKELERNGKILMDERYRSLFDDHLICLLGFGGSIAYGTNLPTSDIDIRGIYINPEEELYGLKPDSETFQKSDSDTVLYSLKKIFKLLTDCNPNVIELLGLNEYDYLWWDDIGSALRDKRHIFLSQKAAYTFGGYAKSQLNRLINKTGRAASEISQNETRSIEKTLANLEARYQKYGDITVYRKDDDILFDMNFDAFPVDILSAFLNEINSVKKDYDKSSRNDKAIAHGKIAKHMMHLIRLYMMGIDLLNEGDIYTYRRGNDHTLLMALRNGEYLEKDGVTPKPAFECLVASYQRKFEDAALTTKLPEKPDYEGINRLYMGFVRDIVSEGREKLMKEQERALMRKIDKLSYPGFTNINLYPPDEDGYYMCYRKGASSPELLTCLTDCANEGFYPADGRGKRIKDVEYYRFDHGFKKSIDV